MVNLNERKMEKNFYLNEKKMRIKKCCASCVHCESQVGHRHADHFCKARKVSCYGDDICSAWRIKESMDTCGGGEPGRIKKLAYLKYVAHRMGLLHDGDDMPSVDDFRFGWQKENKGMDVYL